MPLAGYRKEKGSWCTWERDENNLSGFFTVNGKNKNLSSISPERMDGYSGRSYPLSCGGPQGGHFGHHLPPLFRLRCWIFSIDGLLVTRGGRRSWSLLWVILDWVHRTCRAFPRTQSRSVLTSEPKRKYWLPATNMATPDRFEQRI